MMSKLGRSEIIEAKTSGQISVAKTADTGASLFSDKKKKPSPLPIQIDIVQDNYEPEVIHLPCKMSLGDLLLVDIPKKRKNWRLAIADQVKEEAAQVKHVNLASSSVRKALVNHTCPSSNILSEEPVLGKRQMAGSISVADIKEGIESGLIKWQHLTFSSTVVSLLKKLADKGQQKGKAAVTKFKL